MSSEDASAMGEDSNAKPALVPRLRFPEFRDFGGWQEAQLSQALKFQPGFPFPSTGFNSEGVGLRLIRNRDLRSDEKPVHFSGPYNGDFVVGDGDILVGMDGDFTPCVWRKGNALLNQRVGRVLPKEGSDQRFLFYFLSVHLKAIEDTTARTTVKHLSHSDVERICEPFPKKFEQQKIADCLSSLDELIAAETHALSALKTHKKGLMQQLFPREGQTVPRLRFPEFREFGPWKSKTLSGIATIRAGTTPSRAEPAFYSDGTIPWVKTTDLNNGFIHHTEECITSAAKARINPVGSVLVAMYGGFNQIGRTGYLMVPAATNQAISVLNADESEVLPIYLLTWMNARVESWKRIASSSRKDPNITGTDVANFPIAYPSKDEQRKIADALASLDDFITAQSQKIDALKTHKRGLMQQLFPVLDEVPA